MNIFLPKGESKMVCSTITAEPQLCVAQWTQNFNLTTRLTLGNNGFCNTVLRLQQPKRKFDLKLS